MANRQAVFLFSCVTVAIIVCIIGRLQTNVKAKSPHPVLSNKSRPMAVYTSLLQPTSPPSGMPEQRHHSTTTEPAVSRSTVVDVPKVDTPAKKERQGYLLALSYSDQMTGSTVNLVDFQCWAKKETKQSNLLIVEPFIIRSLFGASMKGGDEGRKENAVRVSDIFDMDVWREYTVDRKGYIPIVKWEDFLRDAPRNLIIASQPPLKECDMEGLANQVRPFSEEHNFTIVRKACFYFHKSGLLSSKQFYSNLYGEYSPEDVTVLFDRWGGINRGGDPWTMGIRDSPCPRQWDDAKFVSKKSKTVSNDVQRYITNYLNGSKDYVVVNVRFQFFYRGHNFYSESKSEKEKSDELDSLINCVVSELNKMKKSHSFRNVLLTTDFGKHGTNAYSPGNDVGSLAGKVEKLFRLVYGTSMTLEKIEKSFDETTSIDLPGYIAIMQQELAGQAECLIVAGGGGKSKFQQQTKYVYTTYHDRNTQCLLEVCQ